ncbi:hypothetical protein LOD99_3321 [Oopsacas minuta]|uniref:Uncharacterized protein n=1 Tax=Oopsacas minuta TaxID=111878 RepID=A0AAV7JXX9_9METZ|nr:hypothetical protein LOD99_3321 [Oopsacas minuta]
MATQNLRANKHSLFKVSITAETRVVTIQECIWELEARKVKVTQAQQDMVSRVEKEFNRLLNILLDAENNAITRVKHAYSPYIEELDSHIADLQSELNELKTLTKHIASLDPSQSILGTYRGKSTHIDDGIDKLAAKLQKPTFLSEDRIRGALKKFSNTPNISLVHDSNIIYKLQQPFHIVVDKARTPVHTVDPNSWGIRIAPYDIKTAGKHLFMLKRYDNIVFVIDPEISIWTCFQVDRSLWYNSVHALAVSRDNVLVSVPDKDCIRILTKQGDFLNEVVRVLGHGSWHELKKPHGMTTTSNNLVVIANTGNDQVLVYNLESDFAKQLDSNPFTSSKLISPTEVAVTKSDDIIVLHQGTPFLHVYSISGELLAKFGTCIPQENGKYLTPRHITVGPKDSIIVVDREYLNFYKRSSPVQHRLSYVGGWGKAVVVWKDKLIAYVNGMFCSFSLDGFEDEQITSI